MSLFLQFVAYALVAYLIIVILMFFKQESFLFFPTAEEHQEHKLSNIQDYSLKQDEVTLRGWLVNPMYAREKLIIYFGGNAEDIFFNVDEYQDIQAASLFVAYRGYGPSDGSPGEAELYSDALAIIDDAMQRYGPKEIYLIGRSLGTGVACFTAAHRAVQGIILVTPYDSIEMVAKQAYSWLPVGLLLKHKFKAIEYLPAVQCPVLIIYGGQDRVVRPERTRELIKYLTGENEILLIDGAEHGTIEMFAEYWDAILRFINRRS